MTTNYPCYWCLLKGLKHISTKISSESISYWVHFPSQTAFSSPLAKLAPIKIMVVVKPNPTFSWFCILLQNMSQEAQHYTGKYILVYCYWRFTQSYPDIVSKESVLAHPDIFSEQKLCVFFLKCQLLCRWYNFLSLLLILFFKLVLISLMCTQVQLHSLTGKKQFSFINPELVLPSVTESCHLMCHLIYFRQ